MFKYILSEPAKKSSNAVNKTDKEKTTKWDEYNEALRDLKCNWLGKLGNQILHIFNTIYIGANVKYINCIIIIVIHTFRFSFRFRFYK